MNPAVPFQFATLLLLAVWGCTACAQKPAKGSTPPPTQVVAEVATPTLPAVPSPGAGAAPHINAQRAMQYTAEIVGFGSRPIGSAAHRRLEAYLRSHLKAAGAQVEEDAFAAETPAGAFPMRNFIAKFPGTRPGIVVMASHYDTVYSLKDFVGANDGGSSTGLLLELANQLRSGAPRKGYSVWLVFFDGEEAVKQWSASDSLYGSRHLSEKWKASGTLGQIKAFLLADMVGDADLNIDRDGESTQWLEDMVYEAAKDMGYQSHFFARTLPSVGDDHTPFVKLDVPSADLIDFDYGYNDVFWHTPEDTLDKLSSKSLQVVGDVMLETLHLLDAKP
jgi:glutaminyl-peptide cyclotransferase